MNAPRKRDIAERLRMWASENLRGIARDMRIAAISVDTNDLRRWADLMDDAAAEIERLRDALALYDGDKMSCDMGETAHNALHNASGGA